MNAATVLDQVPETRYSQWHNPTKHPQRVVIRTDHGQVAFVVNPGEIKQLDSVYDRAIHQIDCGQDECHRKGWFCTKGHDGLIVGGGAPLLQRVGAQETLHPTLDPAIVHKKELETAIAAEALLTDGKQRAIRAAAELAQTDGTEPQAQAPQGATSPPGQPTPLGHPNESKRK